MTYRGRVKGGAIEFDEPVRLPEGTVVSVELHPVPPAVQSEQTLGQKLLKYAGRAKDLPPDMAGQHDHYLYGTPTSE